MNIKHTVISLFAGGGGSSLGYKLAGFKELLAIEWDKNAVETLKANFNFSIWQRDIKEVKVIEILEFLKIEKGQLDILDGSPPCQGFSTVGKRVVNDNRNDLYLEFIRLVKGLQPKVFVMENVSGLIKGRMKGKFNEIMKILQKLNYNVKCKLMNAKYYNVPQSRERLIWIGVRKDLNRMPSFPKANKNIITVKEAIKEYENKFLEDFLEIENLKQGEKRYNYGLGDMRIYRNKPMPTICKSGGTDGGNTPIHYSENRRLTIDEIKKLCSFPKGYKLIGKKRDRIDRLGNSVMPNMMKAIALNIRKNILDKCNE